MKKEKLIGILREMFSAYDNISGLTKEQDKAYKQIVALIKKEVSEEWVEEKAKELNEMSEWSWGEGEGESISLAKAKDFIRKLVQELRG